MSFGQALAETVLTGVSGAAQTSIEKAKQRRADAIQREGWDRQDARIADEQAYRSAESEKQRKFTAEEAEKQRQWQEKNKGKGKGEGMKLTNTDQGTYATLGTKVYQVTEQGLVPLEINPNQVPAGEDIVQEEGESEEGFLDKAANFITGLFDSEPKTMAEAATQGDKPEFDSVEAQFNELKQSGAGFGELDTFIRNSGLSNWEQLKLLAKTAGGSGEMGSFAKSRLESQTPEVSADKGGDRFSGKPYGQTEFDKVKAKYPNASDEQVLKSLDSFYGQSGNESPGNESSFEGFGDKPYTLEDIAKFRQQNPGVGFDEAVELLDKYYSQQ